MKNSEGILFLIGLLAACLGAVLIMVIMPMRIESFMAHGMELPLITLLLLTKPWLSLIFPALTLLIGLLWPNKARRGLGSLVFGSACLLLSIAMILVFGYLPFR